MPLKTSPRKRRILLVDDEPILLRSLARHLELLGWEVVRCADGAQGRDAARSGMFDAIVADFDLPTLPGTDLMDSLADLSPAPRLIITSGHADILQQWSKTTQMPVSVLPKPFVMAELMSIIDNQPRHDGTAPAINAANTPDNPETSHGKRKHSR